MLSRVMLVLYLSSSLSLVFEKFIKIYAQLGFQNCTTYIHLSDFTLQF